MPTVVADILSLKSDEQRSEAFLAIIPYLNGSLLTETIAEVRRSESAEVKARILAAVAARLPEHERREALQEALRSALSLDDDDARIRSGIPAALEYFDSISESCAGVAEKQSRWGDQAALIRSLASAFRIS